jgi:hypothetical protein
LHIDHSGLNLAVPHEAHQGRQAEAVAQHVPRPAARDANNRTERRSQTESVFGEKRVAGALGDSDAAIDAGGGRRRLLIHLEADVIQQGGFGEGLFGEGGGMVAIECRTASSPWGCLDAALSAARRCSIGSVKALRLRLAGPCLSRRNWHRFCAPADRPQRICENVPGTSGSDVKNESWLHGLL